MIQYLGPEDDIRRVDLRVGQIILNLYGRDWLAYDNALIIAETYPALRVWQPERDLDAGYRLTGQRKLPVHPSFDQRPSLYYLETSNLFICDTFDEANEIIEASLPARMAQMRVAEEVFSDNPNRRRDHDDVERMLEVRRASRAEVSAVYAELTGGAFADPEAVQGQGMQPR
jgi:hypothetical protein